MVMGELDYSGYRESGSSLPPDLEIVSILAFIAFCFTMTLVVNNLLVSYRKVDRQTQIDRQTEPDGQADTLTVTLTLTHHFDLYP